MLNIFDVITATNVFVLIYINAQKIRLCTRVQYKLFGCLLYVKYMNTKTN